MNDRVLRDHAGDAARRALFAGLGAYSFWGLVPLYFKLVAFAGADEIIAHRVIWSVGFLALVLAIRNRRDFLKHVAISRKVAAALMLSGALVAVNWLVFVYAVNSDRVLSTSLGYFINPLVSVLLGTLVLRERMYGAQVIAVGLAAAGTIYLTVQVGEPPWLALALAFTFGLYGLVRKVTDVGPMVGLFWETLMMMPLALLWLLWTARHGEMVFGDFGIAQDLLLIGTGLVTVIPLVLFATAARGLPLITVGLMQYLAPSISFCLAVFLFREPFTLHHALAFGAIWSALALYTGAIWQRTRQQRRIVAEAAGRSG
ncbi:MAG TPA: EamA family transporter RarD [Wenzhouxiangellaceae bacterium]|nr:EamA family transporter RarD [Wenzhouxiangellaceae bacterium]